MNQKWTKDQLTIMDGNIGEPKQKEYFINNDKYISKIIFSYIPNIQENLYLQVDRFGEKESKEIKEIEDNLYPTWAINSFTIKGIYIKVETIGIIQDSQIEDELVTFNSQLTSDIQRMILDTETGKIQ